MEGNTNHLYVFFSNDKQEYNEIFYVLTFKAIAESIMHFGLMSELEACTI